MKTSDVIEVIGCHAEGEVGRVIIGGVEPPPGGSVAEMKRHLEADDRLRKLLLYEPRGGAFCHYNLIVPSRHPEADAGFIIMEPADYPPMSGSNSICVATVLLESGLLEMREPETVITLEAPAGLVKARAQCRGGKVERVSITFVPCFALALDQQIDVEDLGRISYDLAYGGDSFAIVDAKALGFKIEPGEARALVETGERIKAAINDAVSFRHPEYPDIRRVSFVQFAAPVGPSKEDGVPEGYNAVVISPGKIDRSPTGTGTCARMAVMHARGQLGTGETYRSRSIIASRFEGRILAETKVGDYPAIVPEITGRAWITGHHRYTLDPGDPYPLGYTLSDTWYRALD